jgi:outer membrane protein TolC/ABC-type uncharacterized transport system substrate-binding protein
MKRASHILAVALFIGISLVMIPQGRAAKPVVRIGIAVDGQWERNQELIGLLKMETHSLLDAEFDVRFPPDRILYADWSPGGVKAALDNLLDDPAVDIVVAGGVIASDDAAKRGPLPKPVVAPFIIDAELQGIPERDGASGVKNLSYVSFPTPVRSDLEAFLQVVRFKRMAVLVNRYYSEALQIPPSRVQSLAEQFGFELTTVQVGESADDALAAIPEDTEAVYIVSLIQLPSEEFDRLIAGLIERKLPSYSQLGDDDVRRGVLVSVRTGVFPKILRRVAINIQRILLGEEPGSIPVAFAPGTQLTVNMATARAIGVYPTWSVLTYARLLNEEIEDIERTVDMRSAIEEALAANRDLSAKQYYVSAGSQQVNESRSHLFPQVDLSALGMTVDEDRARASFGQQPERMASGSVGASQVLYSERAWAGWSIQKSIQRSRRAELEQLRLDIIQDAATAYLDVLRVKTFERIQRENLKRTEKNLEIAQVRESVGVAGPAEVYRWESEIATARKGVTDADALRRVAEIELNRLLNRPLEEPFLTTEEDVHDPSFYGDEAWYTRFTLNPMTLVIVRDFMAEEGLMRSPELAAFDAAIAARERALKSAGRRYWQPDLSVQGEIGRTFWKEGEGSDASALGLDDTNWSVGLGLSFPLIEGGAKMAGHRKAARELEQLKIEREALAERIEQRVRSAVLVASASHAGIEQSRLAAEAAARSLEVVSDAYTRGTVSILDLLDAQNAALVADLAAANAIYGFLVDLLAVDRATGCFDMIGTDEERQALVERVEAYFKYRGVTLDR